MISKPPAAWQRLMAQTGLSEAEAKAWLIKNNHLIRERREAGRSGSFTPPFGRTMLKVYREQMQQEAQDASAE